MRILRIFAANNEFEVGMKRMVLFKIVFSLLICLFLTGAAHGAEEDRLSRIGVLAKRGKERCLEKWSPTAQYLTDTIEGSSFAITPLDFDDILLAVEENTIDFLLSNPACYVRAEIVYGAERIATLENICLDRTCATFGGNIFTLSDRDDINSLDDLRGKRVAAPSENSFGAWILVYQELTRRGIDPYSDFSALTFVGSHDSVVYAVKDGLVDAGMVRTNTISSMEVEGKITPGDLRNIHQYKGIDQEIYADFPFAHSTRLCPEWPLARLKQTPREIAEKVVSALLLLNPDDAAPISGRYAGWTVPANYQMVRDCLKELRINPYQDYGRILFWNVILKYWYWIVLIALFMALLVGIAIHLRRLKNILQNEIDGRKKTVADLMSERAQILSIFDSIEEIVYVTDPLTYEILFTNKYFQNLLGKNPSGEICYREFQNLDRPCDFCTNDIILTNKGKPYRWEYYNPVLDKHLLITDQIIRWPDGRDVRFELAIDITELKRAEDKLRANGENMEEIVDKKTAAMRKIVDLMAGREVRMMELKKTIRILRTQIEDLGMVPVADDPLKRESDQ